MAYQPYSFDSNGYNFDYAQQNANAEFEPLGFTEEQIKGLNEFSQALNLNRNQFEPAEPYRQRGEINPNLWGESDPTKLPSPKFLGGESTDSLRAIYDNALFTNFGITSLEDLHNKFTRLEKLEQAKKTNPLSPEEALEREKLLQELQAGNPSNFEWLRDLEDSYATSKFNAINKNYQVPEENPDAWFTKRQIENEASSYLGNLAAKAGEGLNQIFSGIRKGYDAITNSDDELYKTYKMKESQTEGLYRANGNFADIPEEIALELQSNGLYGHHTLQFTNWMKDPVNKSKAENYASYLETYRGLLEAKENYNKSTLIATNVSNTTIKQDIAEKSADLILKRASQNGSWGTVSGVIGNTLNLISNYSRAAGDYIADTAAETLAAGIPGRFFKAAKTAKALDKTVDSVVYGFSGAGIATTLVGSKIPDILADIRTSKLGTVGSDIDDPSIYAFAAAAAIADYYGDLILNKINLPGFSYAEQAAAAVRKIGLKEFASRVPGAIYTLATEHSTKAFVKALAPEIKDPNLIKHLASIGADLLKEMAGEALAEGSSQYLQNVGSLLGQHGIALDPRRMKEMHNDFVSSFRNAFDDQVVKAAAQGASVAAGLKLKGIPGEISRIVAGRKNYFDQVTAGVTQDIDTKVETALLGDNTPLAFSKNSPAGRNQPSKGEGNQIFDLDVEGHIKQSGTYRLSPERDEAVQQGKDFRNQLLEGLNEFLDKANLPESNSESADEDEVKQAIASSLLAHLFEKNKGDSAGIKATLKQLVPDINFDQLLKQGQTSLTGSSSTDYLRGLLGDKNAIYSISNVLWTMISKQFKVGRGSAQRDDYFKRLTDTYKALKKDPNNKELREKFASYLAVALNQDAREVYNPTTGMEYTDEERKKANARYLSTRNSIDQNVVQANKIQETIDLITAQNYLHALRGDDSGKSAVAAKTSETLVDLAKRRAKIALRLTDAQRQAIRYAVENIPQKAETNFDIKSAIPYILGELPAGLSQQDLDAIKNALEEIAGIQRLEMNYARAGMQGTNKDFARILLITNSTSFWEDSTLNQLANLKYHVDPAIKNVSDSFLQFEAALETKLHAKSGKDALQKLLLLDTSKPDEKALFDEGLDLITRYCTNAVDEYKQELADYNSRIAVIQKQNQATNPLEKDQDQIAENTENAEDNIEDLQKKAESVKNKIDSLEKIFNSLAILKVDPSFTSKAFAGTNGLLNNLGNLQKLIDRSLESEETKITAFEEDTSVNRRIADQIRSDHKNDVGYTWNESFGLEGKSLLDLGQIKQNLLEKYNASMQDPAAQVKLRDQIKTIEVIEKDLNDLITTDNEAVTKGSKVRGSEEEDKEEKPSKDSNPKAKAKSLDIDGEEAANKLHTVLLLEAVGSLANMFDSAWSTAKNPGWVQDSSSSVNIIKKFLSDKYGLLLSIGFKTPITVFKKGDKFVTNPKQISPSKEKNYCFQALIFADYVLQRFKLDSANPSVDLAGLDPHTLNFLAALYDFKYAITSKQVPGSIPYTNRKWGPKACLINIVPLNPKQVQNLYSDATFAEDGTTTVRIPENATEHQTVPDGCIEYSQDQEADIDSYLLELLKFDDTEKKYQFTEDLTPPEVKAEKAKKQAKKQAEDVKKNQEQATRRKYNSKDFTEETSILSKSKDKDGKEKVFFWGGNAHAWIKKKLASIAKIRTVFTDTKTKKYIPVFSTVEKLVTTLKSKVAVAFSPKSTDSIDVSSRSLGIVPSSSLDNKKTVTIKVNKKDKTAVQIQTLIDVDDDLGNNEVAITSAFALDKDPIAGLQNLDKLRNTAEAATNVRNRVNAFLGKLKYKGSFAERLSEFQKDVASDARIDPNKGKLTGKHILEYIQKNKEICDAFNEAFKNFGESDLVKITGVSQAGAVHIESIDPDNTRFAAIFASSDDSGRNELFQTYNTSFNHNTYSYENIVGMYLQQVWNFNQLLQRGYVPVGIKQVKGNTFVTVWVKGAQVQNQDSLDNFKESIKNLTGELFNTTGSQEDIETIVAQEEADKIAEVKKKEPKINENAENTIAELWAEHVKDPLVPSDANRSQEEINSAVNSYLLRFKDLLNNADYKGDINLQTFHKPSKNTMVESAWNAFLAEHGNKTKIQECTFAQLQAMEDSIHNYLSSVMVSSKEELDMHMGNFLESFQDVIKTIAIRKAQIADAAQYMPYQCALESGINVDFSLLQTLAEILGNISENSFDGTYRRIAGLLIKSGTNLENIEGAPLGKSYKQGETFIQALLDQDAAEIRESEPYVVYKTIIQKVLGNTASKEELKSLTTTYKLYNPALARFIQNLMDNKGELDDRALTIIRKNLEILDAYGDLYLDIATTMQEDASLSVFAEDFDTEVDYFNAVKAYLNETERSGFMDITKDGSKVVIHGIENIKKLVKVQIKPYVRAIIRNPKAFNLPEGISAETFKVVDDNLDEVIDNYFGKDYTSSEPECIALQYATYLAGKRNLALLATSTLRTLESTVALNLREPRGGLTKSSPILRHLCSKMNEEQTQDFIERFNSALYDENLSEYVREKLHKLVQSIGSANSLGNDIGASVVKRMFPESKVNLGVKDGLNNATFREVLALRIGRNIIYKLTGGQDSLRCLSREDVTVSENYGDLDDYSRSVLDNLGLPDTITVLSPLEGDEESETTLGSLTKISSAKFSYKFLDCTALLTGVKASSSITCDITQISPDSKHSTSAKEYDAVRIMSLAPNAIRKSVIDDNNQALAVKFDDYTVQELFQKIIDFNKKDVLSEEITRVSSVEAYKTLRKELGEEEYQKFMNFCTFNFGLTDPLTTLSFNQANAAIVTNNAQIKEALYMQDIADQWQAAKSKMDKIIKANTTDSSDPEIAQYKDSPYYDRVRIAKEKINAIEPNAWNSGKYIFFWGEWTEGSNNRYSMLGSQFNPQSDKRFARQKTFRFYALGKKGHRVKDDKGNKIPSTLRFEYPVQMGLGVMSKGRMLANSICQTFGLKPEKKNPRDWTKQAAPIFIRIIKFVKDTGYNGFVTPEIVSRFKQEVLQDPQLKKKYGELELEFSSGLKNILDTCMPFKDTNINMCLHQNELEMGIIERDCEAIFLGKEDTLYADFGTVSFDNWIPIEADGITNGVAIAAFGNIGLHDLFTEVFGIELNKKYFQSSEQKLEIVGCRTLEGDISNAARPTFEDTVGKNKDMYQQVMYAINFARPDSVEGEALPVLAQDLSFEPGKQLPPGLLVVGINNKDGQVVPSAVTDLDDVFRLSLNQGTVEYLLGNADENGFGEDLKNQMITAGMTEDGINKVFSILTSSNKNTTWVGFSNAASDSLSKDDFHKFVKVMSLQILDRNTVKDASIPHNYGAAKNSYFKVLSSYGFDKFLESRRDELSKRPLKTEEDIKNLLEYITKEFLINSSTSLEEKTNLKEVLNKVFSKEVLGAYLKARSENKGKFISFTRFLRENTSDTSSDSARVGTKPFKVKSSGEVLGVLGKNLLEGGSSTSLPKSYVVLDFETTGTKQDLASYNNNDVSLPIEVSIIKVENGVEKGRYHTYIQVPQGRMNPDTEEWHRNNGFPLDKVASEGIPMDQAYAEITKFMGNLPVVGHNIVFDLNTLFFLGRTSGSKPKITNNYYDTLLLAKRAGIPYGARSQEQLAKRFLSEDAVEAHQAEQDNLQNMEILPYLIAEAENNNSEETSNLYDIFSSLDGFSGTVISRICEAMYDATDLLEQSGEIGLQDILTKKVCDSCEFKLKGFFENSIGANLYDAANRIAVEQRQATALIGQGIDQLAAIVQDAVDGLRPEAMVAGAMDPKIRLKVEEFKQKLLSYLLIGQAVETPIQGRDEPYSINKSIGASDLGVSGGGLASLKLAVKRVEAEALAGGVKWIHSLDGVVAALVQIQTEGGVLNIHDAIVGLANGAFCEGNTKQNSVLRQLMFDPDGKLSANMFKAFASYYDTCIQRIEAINDDSILTEERYQNDLRKLFGLDDQEGLPSYVYKFLEEAKNSIKSALLVCIRQNVERANIDFKATKQANDYLKRKGYDDKVIYGGYYNNIEKTTTSRAKSAFATACNLIHNPDAEISENVKDLNNNDKSKEAKSFKLTSKKARGMYGDPESQEKVVTHLCKKYGSDHHQAAKNMVNKAVDENCSEQDLIDVSGMFMEMSPESCEMQGKQRAAVTLDGFTVIFTSNLETNLIKVRPNNAKLRRGKDEDCYSYLIRIQSIAKGNSTDAVKVAEVYDGTNAYMESKYIQVGGSGGFDVNLIIDDSEANVTEALNTLKTYVKVLHHVGDKHTEAVEEMRSKGIVLNNYNFMEGDTYLPNETAEKTKNTIETLANTIKNLPNTHLLLGNKEKTESTLRGRLYKAILPIFNQMKNYKKSLGLTIQSIKKSGTKDNKEFFENHLDYISKDPRDFSTLFALSEYLSGNTDYTSDKFNLVVRAFTPVSTESHRDPDGKIRTVISGTTESELLRRALVWYAIASSEESIKNDNPELYKALTKIVYAKPQNLAHALTPKNIFMSRGSEDASLDSVFQQILNKAEDEFSTEDQSGTLDLETKRRNGEYIHSATKQDLNRCFDSAKQLDAKLGNVSAEEAHLLDLLNKITNGISGVSIALYNSDKKNLGKFLLTRDQKLVVIQRAKERLGSSPFMMSNTEILVHELTHALMTLIPINSKEYKILSAMRNTFTDYILSGSRQYNEVIDFMANDLYNQAVAQNQPVSREQCVKQAKKILRYVTQSDFTVEEFAAYGTTNPIMMHTLDWLSENRALTPKYLNTKDKDKGKTLTEQSSNLLRDLLNLVIDWCRKLFHKTISDKFQKTDNYTQAMCTIFEEVAKTTEPFRAMHQASRIISEGISKVENLIDSGLGKFIGKTGDAIATLEDTKTIQGIFSYGLNKTPNSLQRLIADEVSEVTTNTENGTGIVRQFMKKIAKVDSVRQKSVASDSAFLQDNFPELTSRKHRAIETVMIHSDIQSVINEDTLDINLENLNDVVQNKDGLLDEKIQLAEEQVDRLSVINGKNYAVYMKTQAKNLGHYLATGDHVTVLDCKNAAQISRGFGLNQGDIANIAENLEEEQFIQLTDAIDKLATLRSLKALHEEAANINSKHCLDSKDILDNFDSVYLQQSLKVFDPKTSKLDPIMSRFAGLNAVINYHRDFLEESKKAFDKQYQFAGKFSSRPTYLHKGYTNSITDPSYNCVVAHTKEEVEHLKNQGYVVDTTYPTHERSTSLNIRMVAKYPQVSKYTTGAFSMINEHRAGMSIDYALEGDGLVPEDLNTDLSKIKDVRSNLIHGVSTPMDESDADIEAAYDSNGMVTGVRLITPRYIQAKKMFKVNNFSRSIASARARMTEMEVAEETNKETLKIVYDEQDAAHKLWLLAQAGDADAKAKLERDWVAFTYDSDNADIAADYSIMPEYMKDSIESFADKQKHPLYVRKTQYNLLFGYHNFTIGKFNFTEEQIQACENKIQRLFMRFTSKLFEQPGLGKIAVTSEKGIQMLTQFAKDNIIIRNLAVPVGNMMSNIITLWLSGINPVKAISHSIMGLKNYIDYYEYQAKIAQADRKLKYLPVNSTQKKYLKTRRAEWVQKINDNPITEYLQKVGDNTLVEDFTPEDMHSMNPVRQVFNWIAGDTGDKVIENNNVRLMVNMAMAGKGTVMHKLMSTLTTASDVVSKWAMYEHLKQTKYKFGKDRAKNIELDNKALIEANEAFILYDLPTNKYVQYANDMGIFVFSKFFLRIQKVILRTFKEHPARTIAGYGFMNGMVPFLQESFNESIIPYSYILNPLKILNRFKTPWGFFHQALNVNMSTVPLQHVADIL